MRYLSYMSEGLTCLLFSVPVVLIGVCGQVLGRPVLDISSHHLPLDIPASSLEPGTHGKLHVLIRYNNLSFSSLITVNHYEITCQLKT